MEGGCLTYTRLYIDINFPDDDVRCALCPLLETYSRKQCRRTGEYIRDDRVTGYYCPLLGANEMKKKMEDVTE